MSNVKVDTLQNRLATKSIPVDTVIDGSAKAWVQFNAGSGTPVIVAQLNVSSITDHGAGDYTVNLLNALADAQYVVVYGTVEVSGGSRRVGQNANNILKTASAIRLLAQVNNAPGDLDAISVVFFR